MTWANESVLFHYSLHWKERKIQYAKHQNLSYISSYQLKRARKSRYNQITKVTVLLSALLRIMCYSYHKEPFLIVKHGISSIFFSMKQHASPSRCSFKIEVIKTPQQSQFFISRFVENHWTFSGENPPTNNLF